jgi:hypothetical protein
MPTISCFARSLHPLRRRSNEAAVRRTTTARARSSARRAPAAPTAGSRSPRNFRRFRNGRDRALADGMPNAVPALKHHRGTLPAADNRSPIPQIRRLRRVSPAIAAAFLGNVVTHGPEQHRSARQRLGGGRARRPPPDLRHGGSEGLVWSSRVQDQVVQRDRAPGVFVPRERLGTAGRGLRRA